MTETFPPTVPLPASTLSFSVIPPLKVPLPLTVKVPLLTVVAPLTLPWPLHVPPATFNDPIDPPDPRLIVPEVLLTEPLTLPLPLNVPFKLEMFPLIVP